MIIHFFDHQSFQSKESLRENYQIQFYPKFPFPTHFLTQDFTFTSFRRKSQEGRKFKSRISFWTLRPTEKKWG